MRRSFFVIRHLSFVIPLLVAASALAVRPQSWSFSAQKDFAQGRFDSTVVDSYGQLTLGRSLTPVETTSASEGAEVISAFAQTPDGSIYVATSPEPKIFRIEGDKSSLIYKAPKGYSDITAMVADPKGNLLVALSGEHARLITLAPKDKPASTIKFENDDVDYIWSLAQSTDGALYLGTGPHGKVYKLAPGEDPAVILESTARNVTALAFDKSANLIVGTDAKGLVIRLGTGDAKTKKPFVLLDAGNVDINAILSDKDGNLYVATARAEKENPLGESPEQPETRSKPGAVEPEPVEPPSGDTPNPKKNSPHGAAPATLVPGIYAANQPELPAELKALLQRSVQEEPNVPPSTRKKPALPTKPSKNAKSRKMPSAESPEEPSDSSALYRIAPDGSVSTLMQETDLNYSLLLVGDDLLIGTGNEATGGKLFRYRPSDESLTLLARLKEENLTVLFASKNGDIFLGAANMAQVYRLGSGLAKTGTFTSQVLDASHSASWGRILLQTLPDTAIGGGAKITIATRSANTRDVVGPSEKFWSDWSPEIDPANAANIPSPSARYLQFRITLTADAQSQSPIVSSIKLSYQTENLPPRIKELTVDTGLDDSAEAPDLADRSDNADSSPKPAHITWEATDPNNDTLSFRLYYRPVAAPKSDPAPWSPLVHDLKDATFEWDTRSLSDGSYQVKLIASDKLDNTPADTRESARVSAPFIIDHTPPLIGELKVTLDANKASLAGDATDALSNILDVRYQIDAQGDWQPAAPSDKLFDSLHEAFTLVTRPLAAGAHRITVRVTDAHGNSSYKTATVIVK